MKQETIIHSLVLLGGITIATLASGEVKAIPVVDDFRVDQEVTNVTNSTRQVPDTVDQSSDPASPTDSILDGGTSSEGERDILLEVEALGSLGIGIVSSGNNSTSDQLEITTGAQSKVTVTLQYDGNDNDANTLSNRITENVRDGSSTNDNNVFAIRNFETGINVDLTVTLVDSDGDSISAFDAEGTPADNTLELSSADNGDIFIALSEGDIKAGGIDTNGRFFESNPHFDYTQVSGVEITTLTSNTSGSSTQTTIGEVGFEQIPFEAESSIGIALLGAWGVWKRWKKRGEETVEEVNLS